MYWKDELTVPKIASEVQLVVPLLQDYCSLAYRYDCQQSLKRFSDYASLRLTLGFIDVLVSTHGRFGEAKDVCVGTVQSHSISKLL